MVHGYILSFYDTGFYRRTGGFLKNGFAVSYARTAGTRKPEYSGLDLETAEMLNDLRKACAEELRKKGPAFAKEAENLHRQVLKYKAEKLMRSRRLEEQKREKARKAARRKERIAYIFKLGWLRKR